MVTRNRSSEPVRYSLESAAERTDKWWYLPAVAGVSAALLTLLAYLTATPVWVLETIAVLVLIPATILAVPAVAFDILNEYDGEVAPPGVVLYPAAILVALVVGTIPLVAVVALYLVTWVWRGRNGDE